MEWWSIGVMAEQERQMKSSDNRNPLPALDFFPTLHYSNTPTPHYSNAPSLHLSGGC